jgi:rod shape-determining protein MreB
MQYVKRRYNLVIGERTAEEMKIEIGAAVPLDLERKMDVRGRDQITGLPKTVTVQSSDVTAAIQDSLATIVSVVRSVLERTPPELASDVIDRGIVLTGGGALLRHLDILLTQETGIPCQVAENPLDCVAIGSGVALEYLDVIKRSLPTEEETLVASY